MESVGDARGLLATAAQAPETEYRLERRQGAQAYLQGTVDAHAVGQQARGTLEAVLRLGLGREQGVGRLSHLRLALPDALFHVGTLQGYGFTRLSCHLRSEDADDKLAYGHHNPRPAVGIDEHDQQQQDDSYDGEPPYLAAQKVAQQVGHGEAAEEQHESSDEYDQGPQRHGREQFGEHLAGLEREVLALQLPVVARLGEEARNLLCSLFVVEKHELRVLILLDVK